MRRLPIAIGVSAFVAVTVGSAAFIIDSGPVARSSAAMILLGLMGVCLGGLAGLVLVRAPWSRWLLAATVMSSTVLASLGDSSLFWLTLAVGAVAIVGLSGPWLTLWVRQQPVADQLGRVPVALLASGALAPIVVGLAAHEGTRPSHWTLVVVMMASAWAFGRGLPFGIWGFRIAAPVSGAITVTQTTEPGNYIIAIGILAITGMAWSPKAKQVTAVITPPLPSPVTPRQSEQKESDDADE